MKISSVIVHYNTRERLNHCLDAIEKWGPTEDIEYLVVDNASNNDISDIIFNHSSKVKLISNENNHGWAKAANIGISHSSGEYILFMTPGTLITNGLIRNLTDFLDSHPNAGGVGPTQIDEMGILQPIHTKTGVIRPLWAWQKLRRCFPIHSNYPGERIDRDLPNIKVSCLSGFCFMIRRLALDQAEYFDEWPFMFGEEIDLSLRLNKLGWDCFVLPKIKAVHYQGSSYKPNPSLRRWVEQCRLASRYYWRRKHYGYACGLIESTLGTINFLTRALYNIMLIPISSRQTTSVSIKEDLNQCYTSIKLMIWGQRHANKIMNIARDRGNTSSTN